MHYLDFEISVLTTSHCDKQLFINTYWLHKHFDITLTNAFVPINPNMGTNVKPLFIP
jgi:hypothetical protein